MLRQEIVWTLRKSKVSYETISKPLGIYLAVFKTNVAHWSRDSLKTEPRNAGGYAEAQLILERAQMLKLRRDELFRDFEDHTGKLALAREIKDIDDQIDELTAGTKKTVAASIK